LNTHKAASAVKVIASSINENKDGEEERNSDEPWL
jgi:hypothetical protein